MVKVNGAIYLTVRPIFFIIHPKTTPIMAAITSRPTMISVMSLPVKVSLVHAVMAKFVGKMKKSSICRYIPRTDGAKRISEATGRPSFFLALVMPVSLS